MQYAAEPSTDPRARWLTYANLAEWYEREGDYAKALSLEYKALRSTQQKTRQAGQVTASWVMKLPPYTLLTLLENALKHNGLSLERPLRIEIERVGS